MQFQIVFYPSSQQAYRLPEEKNNESRLLISRFNHPRLKNVHARKWIIQRSFETTPHRSNDTQFGT
jgi:hypothetical protein